MMGEKPRIGSAEAADSLLDYGNSKSRRAACWSVTQNCCIGGVIIIIGLLLLGFCLVFIGFPILFMISSDLQRSMLFMPYLAPPEKFENVSADIPGARNLYVTVNEAENITLGVWHLLPEALINDANQNGNFNYSLALRQRNHPVLLHFHGNAGNRIYNLDPYLKLRQYFHVIAFDYRSFGDSSEAELVEDGLIQDCVELYKWLRAQTTTDIFFWGHSLGAAVSAHTAARLHDEDIVPTGLILEAPYTTLQEEIYYYAPSKVMAWLPWFNATILRPLKKNGFTFETTRHILKIDCPIMILHAKDDGIIPYFLGEKLAKIAREKRNPDAQGNVTFHLFSEEFGYDHWGIYRAPELSRYIQNFISIGQDYSKQLDTSQVPGEEYSKQLDTSQVPGEEYRKQLNTSQVPGEEHSKQLNTSQVPGEEYSNQLNTSQVPEEEYSKQLSTSQVPGEEYSNQLNTSQVPDEEYSKQLNTSEVSEEEYSKQLNTSQVSEKEYSKQSNTSQVPGEEYSNQLNTSQVPEEGYSNQLNTSQVPEEEYSKQLNTSQVPGEEFSKQLNTSQVPGEEFSKQLNTSQVPGEEYSKQLNTSQVPV